jgi:hypothetical protein
MVRTMSSAEWPIRQSWPSRLVFSDLICVVSAIKKSSNFYGEGVRQSGFVLTQIRL